MCPFPLFSQENGIHCSFVCSVTSASGDRPRKEASHGGGVYSFFPGYSYSLLVFLADCSYRKEFPSGILKNFLRLQLHDLIVFEFKM